MRTLTVGHALFAATLIALGILGLITRDFTVVWQPVPTSVPAREFLIYLCALVSLASGVGLLWRRTAPAAARLLLGYLLAWLLIFRLPGLLHSLGVDVYWAACRTAAVASAAWVLYAWLASGQEPRRLGFVGGVGGLRIARALYGMAIIPFGIAHFEYLKQTVTLIPAWLPAHAALAYFTGGAFIAAGIAVLTGVFARLAVVLSALQMGLFLLIVWIPIVARGQVSAFQWGETVVTWVLAVSAWMVADSYRAAAPSTLRHPAGSLPVNGPKATD